MKYSRLALSVIALVMVVLAFFRILDFHITMPVILLSLAGIIGLNTAVSFRNRRTAEGIIQLVCAAVIVTVVIYNLVMRTV